mgnify:CR=1 FL=1
MGQPSDFINWMIDLLTENPPIVLALFILSVVANLIQVYTYFRDQRRLKSEEFVRTKLVQLVCTYEDVLKAAHEFGQDKHKLSKLKEEIKESSSKASLLTESIKQLEKAAQRKLITQTIEHNQSELARLYNEIKDLEKQHDSIGELPTISPETQKAIESQVELVLRKPYEFPRDFVFTSTLLVLFLMFLPWPVDTILLPFLLRYFLFAFFEAVRLYPNQRILNTILKYHSIIVFLACFGVWFQFFNVIHAMLQPLISGMVLAQYSDIYSTSGSWFRIIEALPQIAYVLPLPLALMLSSVDWRYLRQEIREKSLPKIQEALANAGT